MHYVPLFAFLLSLMFIHQATAFQYCFASTNNQNKKSCFGLVTPDITNIGRVCFHTNNTNLDMQVIEVDLSDNWNLRTVDAWVGQGIQTSPRTKIGEPIVDQYPYKCAPSDDISSSCSTQFAIPEIYGSSKVAKAPTYPCDKLANFAVRVTASQGLKSVTAWAAGQPIPLQKGKTSEAKYGTLQILCNARC